MLAVGWLCSAAQRLDACPFCTALRPSWSQQRESADAFAIGTLDLAQEPAERARVVQAVRGEGPAAGSEVELAEPVASEYPGGLTLLFGRRGADGDAPANEASWTWQAVAVSEACLPYAVAAPSLRTPTPERLAWFVRYLEHPESQLAEDAYLEFGHAPYDAVSEVAAQLPWPNIRAWLVDPEVPAERKGLYGLLLGLAPDEPVRRENAALLRQQILAPACDFRSGFDGVLGGYLAADGQGALDLIAERYLRRHDAAEGDVRHALTALRFYHEFGREIPRERIAQAAALLLERPSLAPAVTVDLARWQAWSALPRVVACYDAPGYPQPAMRTAVVGFLLAAPTEAAAAALESLRRRDAAGVADAEERLERLGTAR